MSVLGGSLSYRKKTNDFYVNETGTNDGWVPLPISVGAENLTPEDLESWAKKLGGQNQNQLFVDNGSPMASDSRDNRGNSQLRPFKTLERALIEVARTSFKTGQNNDLYERVSIKVAPGEYEIYNGPNSELSEFDNYGRFQDAASLIGRNSTWIINQVYNTISPEFQSDKCKTDIAYFLNALINDLTTRGNYYVVSAARAIISADLNLATTTPPVAGYFISAYSGVNKRVATIAVLEQLRIRATEAMRNLGMITDPGIEIDSNSPVCADVADAISTYINILKDTLGCVIDPRNPGILNYGAVSSGEFPGGEPTRLQLQAFNSLNSSGVVLPRGVSIVGDDLRKVVFRPKYVPNPGDNSPRGAIFRMTGGNFFSGFTIKDAVGVNHSHHKLSAFEFCNDADLNIYYDQVRLAFSDPSIYYRALDAANLIEKNIPWIRYKSVPSVVPNGYLNYAKIFEAEVVNYLIALKKDLRGLTTSNSIEFGKRFYSAHILPLISVPQDVTNAKDYYSDLLDYALDYVVDSITGTATKSEGGVNNIDLGIPSVSSDSTTVNGVTYEGICSNIIAAVSTLTEIIKVRITESGTDGVISEGYSDGDAEARFQETSIVLGLETNPAPLVSSVSANAVNTVVGASPYIFSATIRSIWGMCGIDGDGSKVSGLKSYLAAQFTVISLQKDPEAFVTNPADTIAQKELGGKRYIGSSLLDDKDYRNFGYKVSNGAYAQLVSCFCIGPALHYANESGGEFSVTNSTSNFGDVSVGSYGFLGFNSPLGAFPQDSNHKFLGYLTPRGVPLNDASDSEQFLVGNIASYQWTDGAYTEATVWQNESLDWKNWYSDQTKLPPITSLNPDPDVDIPTGFQDITFVKITLSGKASDLGLVVEYENGDKTKPILQYVYAPPAVATPSNSTSPNDLYSNVPASYNENISLTRRAKVVEIIEETTLILDVRGISGARGEWFERQTFYTITDSEGRKVGIPVTSSLVSRQLTVKRFIDRRAPADKRFRLLIGLGTDGVNKSRIPPSNYILRKQSGVNALEDQPFSVKSRYTGASGLDELNTDKHKIFYVAESVPFLKAYPGYAQYVYDNEIPNAIRNGFNIEDIYAIELVSANADTEFRAQTPPDITFNNQFYFTDDAEFIVEQNASTSNNYRKKLVNRWGDLVNESEDEYYSRYNTVRILNLLGETGNQVSFYKPGLEDLEVANISNALIASPSSSDQLNTRAYFRTGDLASLPTVQFCRPSTTRISAHTWEYMGYYNYDTSLPQRQTESLGDRVDLAGERSIFRLEKLQKYSAGGRIYATGMDEIGNIIEGDSFRDLKTGEVQTVVRGVSPQVISSTESFVPEVLQNATIVGSFTAGFGSNMDFKSAAKFLLPEIIGDGTSTLRADFISFQIKGPVFDLTTITEEFIARTFRETQDQLELGINGSKVKLDVSSLEGSAENNPTDATSLGWNLAKKATDEQVKTENSKLTYVTPSQLKVWRNELQIQTTKGTTFNVYVGDGWGADPVKFSELAPTAQNSRGYQPNDLSNNLADDSPEFRPLRDFKEVALYSAQFSQTDILVVIAKPGIYLLDREIFNCGIHINGAENLGTAGLGRYDGLDNSDSNLSPSERIKSIKSVIFASALIPRIELVGNTVNSDCVIREGAIFNGSSNSITNVVFWGPEQYTKTMREVVFVGLLEETPGDGYDYDYDKTRIYSKTGAASIFNRFEVLPNNASWDEQTMGANSQGFNHPAFNQRVSSPFMVDDCILAGFLAGDASLENRLPQPAPASVSYLFGAQGAASPNTYHFGGGLSALIGTNNSAGSMLIFRAPATNRPSITVSDCIIGPNNPTSPFIQFERNTFESVIVRTNAWRGNTKRIIKNGFNKSGELSSLFRNSAGAPSAPGITLTLSGNPVTDFNTITSNNIANITSSGFNPVRKDNNTQLRPVIELDSETQENVFAFYGHSSCGVSIANAEVRTLRYSIGAGQKRIDLAANTTRSRSQMFPKNLNRFQRNCGGKDVYDDNALDSQVGGYVFSGQSSGTLVKNPYTLGDIRNNSSLVFDNQIETVTVANFGRDYLEDTELWGTINHYSPVTPEKILNEMGPVFSNRTFIDLEGNSTITLPDFEIGKHAGQLNFSGLLAGGAWIKNQASVVEPLEQDRFLLPMTNGVDPSSGYVQLRTTLDGSFAGAMGNILNQVYYENDGIASSFYYKSDAIVVKTNEFIKLSKSRTVNINFGSQYVPYMAPSEVSILQLTNSAGMLKPSEIALFNTTLGIRAIDAVPVLCGIIKNNFVMYPRSLGTWGGVTSTGAGRFDFNIGSNYPHQTYSVTGNDIDRDLDGNIVPLDYEGLPLENVDPHFEVKFSASGTDTGFFSSTAAENLPPTKYRII